MSRVPSQGGVSPHRGRTWAPYEGTTWGNSSSGRSWTHKASDTGRRWSGCSLDDTNCLTLQQILHSFTAPISEEHAWAVIYESLQCLDRLLGDLATCDTLAHIVSSTDHILIHSDGHIHSSTFVSKKSTGANRPRLRSENKAVAELGVLIFNALDYGLKEDEERQLSPALENILDLMTSADEGETIEDDERPETDDEGIERDHDEQDEGRKGESGTDGWNISRSGVSARLSNLARNHLALPSEADNHFRAVCRALVSEALELSSFMEKVSSRKRDNDDMLQELGLNDWARLWVQVIHELRNGIKLKKTDFSKTPIEYELTPYEILMDDIRSRRYKLNKVLVEGDIAPRMKRDAHDIILDFIRSRPPLKPASDRKLADPRKTSTPLELLMESIRNTDSRASLRKTTGPPTRPLSISAIETSRTKLLDQEPSPIPNRKKMIRPDPNLMSELLNFSDDGSDDDDSNHSEDNEEEEANIFGTKEQPPKREWHKQLTRDLALHGPPLGHRRRHSVTVCETPSKPHKVISVDISDEIESPVSPCSSQSSCSVSVELWNDKEDGGHDSTDGTVPQYSLNTPQMHANLHSEFLNSVSFLVSEPLNGYFLGSHWRTMAWSSSSPSCQGSLFLLGSLDCRFQTWLDLRLQMQYKHWMCTTSPADKMMVFEQWVAALQTLDLTLEEVVHIRSVLTRAELEALPLDGNLKEDVERGKICFLCMRTKFGLFTWGQRCQMCSQQVCKRCCTTLRIPLEHFAAIPVFALSPNSISPEPLEEPSLLSRLSSPSMLSRMSSLAVPDLGIFSSSISAGSTPTSPHLSRKRKEGSSDRPSSTGPTSLPVYSSAGPSTMSSRLFVGTRSMSREEKKASLQGSLMSVCLDCKEMVLQVIRAQKTAKRLQMTKSLFLNLTPVYPKEEVF